MNIRILAVSLFYIFISSCVQTYSHSKSEDFLQGIQMVGEHKSKAEQYATELTRLRREAEIETENYDQARNLYIDAKASFDGWIDRLIINLEQGSSLNDISASQDYNASVQKAASKGKQFMDYMEGLLTSRRKGLGPTILPDLLVVFKDGAIDIWKEYRKAGQQKQQRLIERLQELKWKPLPQ